DEIAILRSLGVTAGQIRGAWLAESLALGLLGGVLGLALGWLGAQGAVRMVSRTVNALYHSSAAEAAALDPAEALLALLASVATCLLAGWLPARTAAATPPAQLLARSPGATDRHRGLWRHPLSALAWVSAGIVLCWVPPLRLDGGGRFPAAGYVAALVWVVGAGILGGRLLGKMAWHLGFLGRRSIAWRLALSHIKDPSSRHRLASAALVCAVAMTAGMAILIASFDGTMRGWIERTFQSDLFISSDGAQSASTENRITPETWRAVAGHPSVARAQVVQAVRMQLPEAETMLVGCDLGFFRDHARPAWVVAPVSDTLFDPDRNHGEVLVSEAFADRFQRHVGDALPLPTPAGLKTAIIAGIFADYGNERGSVLMDRAAFVDWFGDELASSLVLMLKSGADADQVRSELRAAHPGLAVFTQTHLRAEALRIFRQTFSITYALELIGVVVAVAGLGFTLMSLLWERREELATLRSLGCHRREIARATAIEGLLIAVSGVLAGLVVSLALGWLLIHRINRQTFGWTLETHRPWGFFAGLAALVLGAAWITGWGTGFRGAQLPVEREE
ncbi:MAG: ABC transporter permease, partial [Verrucomicrobia bacterium]|nr:ABC transporter permease [Verrucomicrobiota bacterium]